MPFKWFDSLFISITVMFCGTASEVSNTRTVTTPLNVTRERHVAYSTPTCSTKKRSANNAPSTADMATIVGDTSSVNGTSHGRRQSAHCARTTKEDIHKL